MRHQAPRGFRGLATCCLLEPRGRLNKGEQLLIARPELLRGDYESYYDSKMAFLPCEYLVPVIAS